ncbi:unnamed protein product [Prunus armeniaca]|uniref:Uncharacterized protein n=1 Tax=Prunus armeniaca TaxID=36596 RepID=A0A6J5WW53_PRUAR|nr:unnamed protein product [Prunus armeniaca]
MAFAMIDLIPAFTFIHAVITGMEILDLRITSRHANSGVNLRGKVLPTSRGRLLSARLGWLTRMGGWGELWLN